jgi:hypothetical protein
VWVALADEGHPNRARAMMDSESEQQIKRKQADGGSLKKAKPHVHYVALQCYMVLNAFSVRWWAYCCGTDGTRTTAHTAHTPHTHRTHTAHTPHTHNQGSYLGLDEGGNVTATLARPFRWKLEEIAHSHDDELAAPELASSTSGEGQGTPGAPMKAKAQASTGGSGGSDSGGGGGRFFTLCAKLPKDEGKKYWLCCDNGKLTLVVTPTGASFLRAFALGPKFLMWLVWYACHQSPLPSRSTFSIHRADLPHTPHTHS